MKGHSKKMKCLRFQYRFILAKQDSSLFQNRIGGYEEEEDICCIFYNTRTKPQKRNGMLHLKIEKNIHFLTC